MQPCTIAHNVDTMNSWAALRRKISNYSSGILAAYYQCSVAHVSVDIHHHEFGCNALFGLYRFNTNVIAQYEDVGQLGIIDSA